MKRLICAALGLGLLAGPAVAVPDVTGKADLSVTVEVEVTSGDIVVEGFRAFAPIPTLIAEEDGAASVAFGGTMPFDGLSAGDVGSISASIFAEATVGPLEGVALGIGQLFGAGFEFDNEGTTPGVATLTVTVVGSAMSRGFMRGDDAFAQIGVSIEDLAALSLFQRTLTADATNGPAADTLPETTQSFEISLLGGEVDKIFIDLDAFVFAERVIPLPASGLLLLSAGGLLWLRRNRKVAAR